MGQLRQERGHRPAARPRAPLAVRLKIAAWLVRAWWAPPAFTGPNLLGHLWLATGGTALAYSLWCRGIASLPVASLSVLGLLSPVVATLAGWLLLGQALTVTRLAGMGLVLLAVAMGQRPAPVGVTTRPAAQPLVAPAASPAA